MRQIRHDERERRTIQVTAFDMARWARDLAEDEPGELQEADPVATQFNLEKTPSERKIVGGRWSL